MRTSFSARLFLSVSTLVIVNLTTNPASATPLALECEAATDTYFFGRVVIDQAANFTAVADAYFQLYARDQMTQWFDDAKMTGKAAVVPAGMVATEETVSVIVQSDASKPAAKLQIVIGMERENASLFLGSRVYKAHCQSK